jgi:hypothetical protein
MGEKRKVSDVERPQRNLRLLFLAAEISVFLIPIGLYTIDRSRFMVRGDPIGDFLSISYYLSLVGLLIISSALLNTRQWVDRFLAAFGVLTIIVACFLATL